MKLLIFVMIVIVVCLLGASIKVYHIGNLSPQDQKIIREKIRVSNLLGNETIKSHNDGIEGYSQNEKSKSTRSVHEIIEILQEWVTDNKIVFNPKNTPVKTKNKNHKYTQQEKRLFSKIIKQFNSYVDEISKEINNKTLHLADGKIIFIEASFDDSLIYSRFKFRYQDKTFHINTTHYINHKDMEPELTKLEPISQNDY